MILQFKKYKEKKGFVAYMSHNLNRVSEILDHSLPIFHTHFEIYEKRVQEINRLRNIYFYILNQESDITETVNKRFNHDSFDLMRQNLEELVVKIHKAHQNFVYSLRMMGGEEADDTLLPVFDEVDKLIDEVKIINSILNL